MNYLLLLYIVLMLLAALEFLPASKQMHRLLWLLAFVFTAVLCTIKFCYGPDNVAYQPFYEKIKPIGDVQLIDQNFESGYVLFNSLLKTCGLSFWGMTAVISVIYFAVLYAFIREIGHHRVFALLIIFVLDCPLILIQFRECLAVSALMFAYLLYERKRYVATILSLVLVVLLHKSGIVFAALFLVAWVLKKVEVKSWMYYILMGVLLLGTIIHPQLVISSLSKVFGLFSGDIANSILLHFSRAKRFQTIVLLYMMVLGILAWQRKQQRDESGFLEMFVFLCMAMVMLLYPYYFILQRLRSYVIPFVILLIMRRLAEERQLQWQSLSAIVCTFACICVFAVRDITTTYAMPIFVYEHTIFDANTPRKQTEIQKKWTYDAHMHWTYTFQREKKNEVKVSVR